MPFPSVQCRNCKDCILVINLLQICLTNLIYSNLLFVNDFNLLEHVFHTAFSTILGITRWIEDRNHGSQEYTIVTGVNHRKLHLPAVYIGLGCKVTLKDNFDYELQLKILGLPVN